MNHAFHDLRRRLFAVGIAALLVPIAAVSAVAQTGQSAGNDERNQTGAVVVDETGSDFTLGNQVVDGGLTVTGSNINVVVAAGTHIINGSVQINGSGDRFIVEFDETKGHGQIKVNGSIILGPDNAPTLGVDLSRVNLSQGARFVIVDAADIVGQFNGLPNEGTLTIGEYTLRIVYDGGTITLVVIDAPRRNLPFITPVTRIDPGLIDPSSTEPGSW